MTQFFILTAVAASVDLLTKAIATTLLQDGQAIAITRRMAFMLVYNTGAVGGMSWGEHTVGLSVLLTIGAIAMVLWIVKPLAVVDPRALLALSLVTGGAFGNLASMLAGPAGVADFLALQLGDYATIVINVADLLLWGGAILLVPVILTLLRAVRRERRRGS